MKSIRDIGDAIRAMVDEEDVDGVERKRTPLDVEWPGYDQLTRDEKIKFWAVRPLPGTPARSVL